MEELPTLTSETLDAEAVVIMADGMGTLLVTRTLDDAGNLVWSVVTGDALVPVEMG